MATILETRPLWRRSQGPSASADFPRTYRVRAPEVWETQRSRKIFAMAQYNWLWIPMLLAIVYPFFYRLLNNPNNKLFYVPVDDTKLLNRGAVMWLLMVFPSKSFLLITMLTAFWPCRPFRLSQKPIIRPLKRLLICLVTRGDQEKVVQRSVLPVQDKVPLIDPRISFHVLTEEQNASKFRAMFRTHVQVHGVPTSYTPRTARYKARSLEWFRLNLKLRDDDWVLHIDEETVIDEYLIRKCVEFITKQDTDDIATGVIHFNSEPCWWRRSLLSSIGDLSRVQADWGRCQFQANAWAHATLGIHGAFFLTSGKVENAVTWETPHLTEDYAFLVGAMRRGFRIGWVPAIAREVSPQSIGDYIRQRRRWFTGIYTLGQWEGRWVLFSWPWVLFEAVHGVWRMEKGVQAEPLPRWLFCALVFEMACARLFTVLTVLVQDWDAGAGWLHMAFSQIVAQLCTPWVNLLDAWAVVTMLVSPDKGFYIVKKE